MDEKITKQNKNNRLSIAIKLIDFANWAKITTIKTTAIQIKAFVWSLHGRTNKKTRLHMAIKRKKERTVEMQLLKKGQ